MFCTYDLILIMSIFEIVLNMSNFNNNNKIHKNYASFYYNTSNQTGKIPSFDSNEIQTIGLKTSINYWFYPIGREIVVSHAG